MVNCNLKKNKESPKCNKGSAGEGVFTIIIPKADNSSYKFKNSLHKKYIQKINNRFFGSTTKPITLGCYNDPSKKKNQIQCESGMSVMTVRDFDNPYDEEIKKCKSKGCRIKKLNEDYNYIKKIAKEIGDEYGQDSVMVTYDNVVDTSFIKGNWKERVKGKTSNKKINKNKLFDDNI